MDFEALDATLDKAVKKAEEAADLARQAVDAAFGKLKEAVKPEGVTQSTSIRIQLTQENQYTLLVKKQCIRFKTKDISITIVPAEEQKEDSNG